MKLFSVSIGLMFAALGVFFVPVSFSVDGFGLVVNPGGVRTVRAVEGGHVLHFAARDGRFQPGDIITAVTYESTVADNALLERTMRRELAKIESDYLEKTSKIVLDLERDRAKRNATAERLAARQELTQQTRDVVISLREFSTNTESDISDLNAERLEQLARLEDLVKRSEEVNALPAQRLAGMLDDIQSDRLSVITSKGTRFSNEKMVLDMIKQLNDLEYSNSIDRAEVEILTRNVTHLEDQLTELAELRDRQRAEAEARYLAKASRPQIAVADGRMVDMRTLQASRAEVAKNDALRLLATGESLPGVQILIYGTPASGEIALRHGTQDIALALPIAPDDARTRLEQAGLEVIDIHSDSESAGATDVTSVFIELADRPEHRLNVVSGNARDAGDLPVLAAVDVSIPDLQAAEKGEKTNKIIGFLENRHAVVLKPGQRVRGSISDTRTGAEIVFEGRLRSRDFSTVDTKELGIRLGNESLAAKIIKRGVLSQVVVGVSDESAQKIEHLPGAVLHLSFPLARQSLFSFLLARNDTI